MEIFFENYLEEFSVAKIFFLKKGLTALPALYGHNNHYLLKHSTDIGHN
jgi:hypothetical protein